MRAEASRGKTPERGAGVEGLPRVIAERSKDSFLRAGALLLLAALLAAAPDPWQVCCLIAKHDFIDPWTRIPRFHRVMEHLGVINRNLSWATFITNIPGSDFWHTQVVRRWPGEWDSRRRITGPIP
jgi:hypothetical protein